MARSTARKRALNTLYEADEKGQDILSLLDERIAHPGAQTPLPQYAIDIVRGMAVVDRNILRIAAWEILFNDDVPDRVAIDEALALAKTLCDGGAPAFIHGLLSAVCDSRTHSPAADPAESTAEAAANPADPAADAADPSVASNVTDD